MSKVKIYNVAIVYLVDPEVSDLGALMKFVTAAKTKELKVFRAEFANYVIYAAAASKRDAITFLNDECDKPEGKWLTAEVKFIC